MSHLLFRGAIIRHFDVRAGEDGIFARIHVTSDFSSPVREALDWDDVPDCVPSCKLTGKLDGRYAVLTPNQPPLRQHELQISVSDLSDFQLHRIQGKDGESARTELRFIARTVQEGAAGLIENWMRRVGQETASLRIEYQIAEQKELFDKPDGGSEEQMTLGGQPEAAGEVIDAEYPEGNGGPALASVVQMAGNTAELQKLARKAKATRPENWPELSDDGLRRLRWSSNEANAVIEIYADAGGGIGAAVNGIIGNQILKDVLPEPHRTIPHAIVEAAGIMERWGRSVFERAKRERDRDSERLASELVHRAIEWAGQARVEGRTA